MDACLRERSYIRPKIIDNLGWRWWALHLAYLPLFLVQSLVLASRGSEPIAARGEVVSVFYRGGYGATCYSDKF